jgi:hypothetical protein
MIIIMMTCISAASHRLEHHCCKMLGSLLLHPVQLMASEAFGSTKGATSLVGRIVLQTSWGLKDNVRGLMFTLV